jgi:hypothetical protein
LRSIHWLRTALPVGGVSWIGAAAAGADAVCGAGVGGAGMGSGQIGSTAAEEPD